MVVNHENNHDSTADLTSYKKILLNGLFQSLSSMPIAKSQTNL